MKKEGRGISFEQKIVIAYVLIFLFSFSYKFGGYFYQIINNGSLLGMVLAALLNVLGMFIFPFVLIFTPVLDSSITFLPFAFTTMYSLIVIFALFMFVLIKKEKVKKDNNFFIIIIFTITAFLTTIINGHPPGFGNWEFTHYITAIICYFIISTLISTKKKMRLFTWVFVLFMGAMAFRLFNWVYSYNTAIWGLSGGNNHLARLFSFVIFFVIGAFWAEKKNYLKVLIVIILAFLANGIVQLGSRATMMSVLVAGVFLFFHNIRKRSTWVFALLAFVLVAFFAPSLFFEEASTISQISEGTEAEEGSISSRTGIALIGFEVFTENPIIGYGIRPMGFVQVVKEKYGLTLNAHNSYIIVAVEMGIVGLISYVLLYFMSIYLCFKAQKLCNGKDDYLYHIANGTMFGVIALSINNFMLNQPWQMIFIAAGISSAVYYLANNLEEKTELSEEELIKEKTKDEKNKPVPGKATKKQKKKFKKSLSK